MSYKLVLKPEAIFDLQEAFNWYEAQKTGLGYELIGEVDSSFEKIIKHPLHYTAIKERYRRLKVNRFPYLIIFETVGNSIIILAMRHTSRRPKH